MPTAGMLANCMVGPANGSGKRSGSPKPPPSGRKVTPLNMKSRPPSARCSNFAHADPYWPGNWIGTFGKFGLTATRPKSAEFMNEKFTLRFETSPVRRFDVARRHQPGRIRHLVHDARQLVQLRRDQRRVLAGQLADRELEVRDVALRLREP